MTTVRGFGPDRDLIFLSYRRSSDVHATGRLADDLRDHFGDAAVFRDLDSNRPAHDYVPQIDEALSRAKVVLAVIGPQWLESRSAGRMTGLADPQDPVRLELERALTSGVLVLPVLVGGATHPPVAALPASLAALHRLHSLELRDGDWQYGLGRLYEVLEANGVVPRPDESDDRVPVDLKQAMVANRRYERTLAVTRRRALGALGDAARLLRYADVEEDAERAQVSFTTMRREVVTKVVDASPGRSTIVVEFNSLRSSVLAGGAILTLSTGGIGIAGWAALRVWERRFAVGFLDNVQGLIEGRGIEEDSSLFPGVHRWRTRSREV